MSEQHTPRPWQIIEVGHQTVIAKSDFAIAVISTDAPVARHGKGKTARVETRKNAGLISASPDLLAVCRKAAELLIKAHFEVREDYQEAESVVDRISEAISKAQGE